MFIREILAAKEKRPIVAVRPNASLRETAGVLRQQDIGAVLVTDAQSKILGIISERDLVRAVWNFGNDLANRSVSEVMTCSVITCTPADDVLTTLAQMNERAIRHIPLIEAGTVQAMISIREFEHACRQLEVQAYTDELTGLANRRLFMGVLTKEVNRYRRFQTPYSVAMLDIDHFKVVNDKYGHEAGDKVLRTLSDLMVRELRPFDEVARLGGEEFAILFPNTELEDALKACQRLLEAIRQEEVADGGAKIRFTASFGLVCSNDPALEGGTVLKQADQLLYKAKSDGRDRVASNASAHSAFPADELKSATA